MTSIRKLAEFARIGRSGRRWYARQTAAIAKIAAWYDLPFGRLCDILAITSPRCSVRRNLRVAMSYALSSYCPPDVTRFTRAALAHYESTGRIRGPKTARFARALRGDSTVCPIDVWLSTALDIDHRSARNVSVQRAAERRLSVVADTFGWTLTETQAAVWCGYLRSIGRTPSHYPIGEYVPF